MRVLEDRGKEILRQAGLDVPRSEVVRDPREAGDAFARVNSEAGAVVKALVPVGGRGKKVGVKHCRSAEEAEAWTGQLLGVHFGGWPTESVLIEEAVDGGQELYAAITIDEQCRHLLALTSREGGVDVNERSTAVQSTAIDLYRGLPPWQARALWRQAGMPGQALHVLGKALQQLFEVARRVDAVLLEVNPLKLTDDGRVLALDCVLTIDDFAIYRQQEIASDIRRGYGRPPTQLEIRAQEVDDRDPYQGTARYHQVDGDGSIGFVCGGGGGSLSVYDAVLRHGGRPANYSEMGGNPPARKVEGLTSVVLSTPNVAGLLVCCNTTNNTQVDKVAEGVVEALRSSDKDLATFPVIFRFPGINETRAREILEEAGITFYGLELTMEEAARLAVERIGRQ